MTMSGASAYIYTVFRPDGARQAFGTPAASVGYDYDGVGRRSAMMDDFAGSSADAGWTYARDAAGGLRAIARDNDSYAWTGHYAVNRAYTTNGLNQYAAAGGATFGYDANGNLTSDGATTYAYDIENRLISATGGHNATLAYDPLGRLAQVTATATGAITRFLYDGDALVAEYNGSGTMIARHLHAPGADVPMVTFAGTNLATPRFLYADHQASIIATADSAGISGTPNTYDEYGIPGAGNTGRFQYTGQIFLVELGLYYYKARFYTPTMGRFLQTDPIGYADQFNLYAYVGNDPVNRSDPSGLQSCAHAPCPDVPLPSQGDLDSAAAAVGPSHPDGGPEHGGNSYQSRAGGETRLETGRAAGRSVSNEGHQEFEHHLRWNNETERPSVLTHTHNGSDALGTAGAAQTASNNAPSEDDQRAMDRSGAAVQVITPNMRMTLYRKDNQDHVRVHSGDRSHLPPLRSQHIIVDPEEENK